MQLYRRVFPGEPLRVGRIFIQTERVPPNGKSIYVGSPESANMPASWFLPYVEKMSIKNDIIGQSISALHQYSSLEFSQETYFLFERNRLASLSHQ